MNPALALLAAAPLVLVQPVGEPLSRPYKPATPQAGESAEAVCRDRIHQVREERGLPKLARGTASPDAPYFIAAVDRRIDGCSVMVMRNDIGDIRPIPASPANPSLLMPAR